MKHLKTYENNKKDINLIELIEYPSGYIVNVTQEEFDLLSQRYDISWDDETDYKNTSGQYGYNDDDLGEDYELGITLEEWLIFYRKVGNAEYVDDNIELLKHTKKYNL